MMGILRKDDYSLGEVVYFDNAMAYIGIALQAGSLDGEQEEPKSGLKMFSSSLFTDWEPGRGPMSEREMARDEFMSSVLERTDALE